MQVFICYECVSLLNSVLCEYVRDSDIKSEYQ